MAIGPSGFGVFSPSGYGVTPTGFRAKSLTLVLSEVDAGLKTILGDSAGTEPDGSIPLAGAAGQLKSMLTDGFAAHWDLLQGVYSSRDPNQATDASQDAVAALSGTIRAGAQKSTATGTCTGDAGTLLQAGRAVKVAGTGSRFASRDEATIAALTAWAALTAYAPPQRRTNNGQAFQCTASGTSAATVGPSGTAAAIADGSATWKYLGEGAGAADAILDAEVAGPIGALADTLTDISTPVSGWRNVRNLADAIVGRNQEMNAQLRARRDAELAAAGNATPDAIRANVLKVNQGSTDPAHTQPTAVSVFYNDQDFTDANGLPPHSVEVLVQGGTDADVALEVWRSVGAGTATYGNTSATVVDSEGNPQTVRYTRPTDVPIWVVTTGRYDASAWPDGSDASVVEAITSALLTYGITFEIGVDVRLGPLMAAGLRGPQMLNASGFAQVPAPDGSPPVPGLLELDPLYFGTASGPSASSQITISPRQVATFDSTRLTVTASTEDP